MAMTDTEIAVKALEYLEHYTYPISTSQIKRGLYLETFQQAQLRGVLLKLASAGWLEVQPGGKHTWRLRPSLKDKWDRNRPFSRPEVDKAAPFTTDDKASPMSQTEADEWKRLVEGWKAKYDETVAAANKAREEGSARIKELEECVRVATEKAAKLAKDLEDAGPRTIVVKHPDGTKVKFPAGTVPKVFAKLMQLATCRMNVMLVGPAGSGKTTLGAKVAEALKLPFGAVNCTAGMSEGHLTGRSRPKLSGKDLFVKTKFLECYENGGVFLLDELDAADSNLLLVINTALANGYCNVPNRDSNPVALRHQDFVCIGTANTVGRGGDRMYVGRNQLDAATLDRFQIGMLNVSYSMEVEEVIAATYAKLANGHAKTVYNTDGRKYVPKFSVEQPSKAQEVAAGIAAKGYDLLESLWYVRDRIDATTGMRRVMSTRFIKDACVMVTQAHWTIQDVLEAYFCGWSAEEVAKMA